MAVYKLFPSKDTFIFSEVPLGNAGYDEMIEIGGYPILDIGQTCRALLQFETAEIQNVIDTKTNGAPVAAFLNIKLASAYETPTSHSVLAYPVAEYWDGGVGKYGDYPFDKSGCSWRYAKANMSGSWTLPWNSLEAELHPNSTGSYNSTYPGGGVWLTGSNGINLEASQSFETNSDLDLNINVTNATLLHYSGAIDNNGFILKFNSDIEFNLNSAIRHKFYSSNTNTIYPPTLDIKWDDSVYETGSLNMLTTDIAEIDITNNKGEYPNFGKQRFRLLARPKYPARTFTTGSIYKVNYALPSGSYWGLRDEFTQEMVVPFDNNYTKISCDSTGPYFDVFLEGIQPERYYRILVKTEIDGTTAVINRDNIFKVVRNG